MFAVGVFGLFMWDSSGLGGRGLESVCSAVEVGPQQQTVFKCHCSEIGIKQSG